MLESPKEVGLEWDQGSSNSNVSCPELPNGPVEPAVREDPVPPSLWQPKRCSKCGWRAGSGCPVQQMAKVADGCTSPKPTQPPRESRKVERRQIQSFIRVHRGYCVLLDTWSMSVTRTDIASISCMQESHVEHRSK